MSLPPRSSLDRILETMRVGLHVLFALLLALGVGTTLAALRSGGLDGPDLDATPLGATGAAGRRAATAAMLLLAAALAATYLAGTVWENRFARRRTQRDPAAYRAAWLGLVLGQWLGLILLSAHFVWLLFPLTFLVWHAVPRDLVGFLLTALSWGLGVGIPAAGWPLLTGAPGWGLGGVFGPLLGVGFASGCYFAYRALHREAAHHRRVAEQLAATQERLLLAENNAGRLAERERLSREIHDTLAQGLNSIVLFSRACQKNLRALATEGAQGSQGTEASEGAEGTKEAEPSGAIGAARDSNRRLTTAREQLATIHSVATENLAEARLLVAGGAPNTGDLSRALSDLGARVTERHGLPVEVVAPAEATSGLPAEVSTTLLRVAQEALTNVVRHAHATRARLTLARWDAEIALDVYDDGTGFDPASARGYGLPGIRARLDELGGGLHIDSSPRGTVVAARVPWEQS
ncbi:sensor histidine kinase [Corynebacterium mastitidis]|uniref:sensor histidine kinase n=1 Tax=Corynebacterium mastitidis TaxID=161890 RepID=UPI0003A7BFED|nr:sensor histidine kinase [Corynebacterium mastitidis]